MNDASILPILLVVAVFIVSIVWTSSRSRAILDLWAQQNGFQILNSSYCLFFRGPYAWTSSRNQSVYRVEVQDASGNPHSGWVRCGSWWAGLMSNDADVTWD